LSRAPRGPTALACGLKVAWPQPEATPIPLPRRPITPRRLRLTGATETPAERVARVLKTVPARCAGYLSEPALSAVLRTKPKARS
jgi:hypothetical protein